MKPGLISMKNPLFVAMTVLGTFLGGFLVEVHSQTYDSLRIYVLENGRRYISSMTIHTDEDTTLYVEGKRSDNGNWVSVPVIWTSLGLTLTPSPSPTAAPSYDNFQPTVVGSGRIITTRQGTSGTIRDTLAVTVLPGLPSRLALYPAAGAPGTSNQSYPDQTTPDTVVAGTALNLVAKLFDQNNVWLGSYERATAPISWRVVELAGNNLTPTGSLTPLAGHTAVFTPQRAYNTVDIYAEYSENGQQFNDIIRVYVKPDTARSLVIEASPNPATSDLNQSAKITTVTFTKTDSIKYAYAVLRDRFGNFVSSSSATDWLSRDITTAQARENNPANGEGTLIRISKSGQTVVRATARGNASLTDSITVVLQSITYDSLRIVAGGNTTRINNLVMRTDQDTIIQVQGKRSDNGSWESVPGTWWITPGFRTTPAVPALSESWSFMPTDTGSGIIVVSLTSSVPDTITFRFTHGLPASMALYPAIGQPVSPYPSSGSAIIDTAGRPLTVVAKIFDANGVWLQEYERVSAPISWDTVELAGNNPPTGGLSTDTGYVTVFTPIRSFNSVYIIATFNENNLRLKDTIQVRVVSGQTRHLVIESDQNPPRNSANPITTVVIPDSRTFSGVYAILRDSLWNFVDYAPNVSWASIDTNVVYAFPGNATVGEGVIKRNTRVPEDTTEITATSGSFKDTAAVAVLAYHFTQLRIVARPGDTTAVTSVGINTNQWDSLYVIGLRSDTALWVPVFAKWETSPGLQSTPGVPENAPAWIFSPDSPGSGWIRVTIGNDGMTAPDTILASFTRGQFLSADFELLISPSGLVAGDTILAVLRIRNDDGLIPGVYCFNADSGVVLSDALGSGGRAAPVVITSVDTAALGTGVDVCFHDGQDTMKIVLYFAPVDRDSTHNLTVRLGGMVASTGPFSLAPAVLDIGRLVITGQYGVPIDTSLLLNYLDNSAIVLRSRTYDRYGNDRGFENADWKTTGTLPVITRPLNTSRIFYDLGSITDTCTGLIIAVATDTTLGIKADTVAVEFQGPPNTLTRAVTRDIDGDGYLDRIILHFDRPVTLSTGFKDSIAITYGGTWVNDSLRGQNGTLDSVYILYIHENPTIADGITDQPQTSLTPYISLHAPGVATVTARTMKTTDGAGPVLRKVENVVNLAGDRTQDIITVCFSEKVLGADGQSIASNTIPASMLLAWRMVGDSLVPDTAVLTGIAGLVSVGMTVTGRDSMTTVSFRMLNNAALTTSHLISINTIAGLADKAAGNFVEDGNVKVPVLVIGRTLVVDNASDNRRHCGACGTGVGLAFFPAIGFKIRALRNRRRRSASSKAK